MAKEAVSKVLSVEGREVQITHPDKLYFSSQTRISKLDLVRYYLSVAAGALAGIRDRPIVLKRFVNGAEAEAFLSKACAHPAAPLAANSHAVIPFGPNCGGDRGR
jgi:bifunctional non-homologous end joining protein LigD